MFAVSSAKDKFYSVRFAVAIFMAILLVYLIDKGAIKPQWVTASCCNLSLPRRGAIAFLMSNLFITWQRQ